jgi:ribonuclease HI
VVEAFRTLPEGMHVWISTESAYVKRAITEWIPIWLKDNWKNSKKATVSNKALWPKLLEMVRKHRRVEWSCVKAHSVILLNEWSNVLATRGVMNDRCPPPVQSLVPTYDSGW